MPILVNSPSPPPQLRIIKQLPLPSASVDCLLLRLFLCFMCFSSCGYQCWRKSRVNLSNSVAQPAHSKATVTFPHFTALTTVGMYVAQQNRYLAMIFETLIILLPFSIMKMERNGNERLFWSFWGKKPTTSRDHRRPAVSCSAKGSWSTM